jgi:hypothetical protein
VWAQIRLNGLLRHLRQETTPQNDRDLGIVSILVGFAARKPAEFVVIAMTPPLATACSERRDHEAERV